MFDLYITRGQFDAISPHSKVVGRPLARLGPPPRVPDAASAEIPAGTRALLERLGPRGFAQWMLDQRQVRLTDTTFRVAHQSLLATRMRTFDMVKIANVYARDLSGLLSVECWGGATFDVSMRFLNECPWERLRALREGIPNILLQALVRGTNGIAYPVYPNNVVHGFVQRAATSGVDLFRVFDSLNWVENMRPTIDAIVEQEKLCEAVVCYTGDIFDKTRSTYNLDYYVRMAHELKAAGTHVLGIKDMVGLLKPKQTRI
jgi:pyruvate carboxylase